MTYLGLAVVLILIGVALLFLAPGKASQAGYALVVVGAALLILLAVLAALRQVSAL